MSLTKVTYSMIQGASANVLDFGADSTGIVDATAAIQAAATSLTTNGGTLYLPSGTYKISASITLPSNVWVLGSGIGNTVITGVQFLAAFIATSKSNIKISDLSCLKSNLLTFVLCNDIVIDCVYINCYVDNQYAMGTQAIYFQGCSNTVVSNSKVVDAFNSVYFGNSDTTSCTNGVVTNCTFIIEHIGTYWQNPVHVYLYYADDITVSENYFVTKDPGGYALAPSTAVAYSVYAGDGEVGQTKIVNNYFRYVPGNGHVIHVLLWATTKISTITGNTFGNDGTFKEIYGISVAGELYTRTTISENNFFNGNTIQVNGGSHATITNNTLVGDNVSLKAINIIGVLNSVISGNIIEGNTNVGIYSESDANGNSSIIGNVLNACGSPTVDAKSPIVVITNSTAAASVVGNVIRNTNALHGIYFNGKQRNIISANLVSGNTGVPVYNGYVAAPTTGTWNAGDMVFNTSPASGQPAGWMCVTGGTPGTWKAMANLA